MPSTGLPRTLLPLALSCLAACTTVAGERTVQAGQPFELAPGAQVALAGGGTLRYVGMANDSRCAPDVQCVWAGDAEVAMEWKPQGATAISFSLHTTPGRTGHALDAGRRLLLVALQRGPAPAATLRIDAP